MRGASWIVLGGLVLAMLCAPPALLARDADPAPVQPPANEDEAASPPGAEAPPDGDSDRPGPQPQDPPPADDDDTETEPAEEPAPGPEAESPQGEVGRAAEDAVRAAAAPAEATVAMLDFSFDPSKVTIQVGGTVMWVNEGPDEPHNAVADDGSFDTGNVAVGASATHTFESPGTFAYTCTLHPDLMDGKVVVKASGGGGSGGGGGGGSEGAEAPAAQAPVPSLGAQSEIAATAAPDAAGTASKLPATGLAAIALAVIGSGLLCAGLLLKRGARLSG